MPASISPDGSAAVPLRLTGIRLDHRGGDGRPFTVLDLPDLAIRPGALVGLRGASGSGKTTLLHLIAGLVAPDVGTVSWGDRIVSTLPAGGRDRWRRETVGFVFQDFHLIPELDIAGNIALPLTFSRWRADAAEHERVAMLAARMGLTDLGRKAGVLSRGEQQRVAIARAVLNRPALILADEPTASLDAAHAAAVGTLLVEVARQTGATLVCASHDPALLALMDERIEIGARAPAPLRGAA